MNNNYQISISPLAAEQIKLQLIKRNTPDGYLRLGLKGSGGCNGYSYIIKFEDDLPKEKDLIFELHGVHIVVDPKSIVYLNGATLDYEKTLLSQGFKFINSKEVSRCGCGSSINFNV